MAKIFISAVVWDTGAVMSASHPAALGKMRQSGGKLENLALQQLLEPPRSAGVAISVSQWREVTDQACVDARYNPEEPGTPLSSDESPRQVGTHQADGRRQFGHRQAVSSKMHRRPFSSAGKLVNARPVNRRAKMGMAYVSFSEQGTAIMAA